MRLILFARPDPASLRRTLGGWDRVQVWLPALLASMVIACESTTTFSAAHTDSWLRPVVERLTGHIDDQVWWWMHHIFRKSGHFCGYGLVCLTYLRGWLLTLEMRPLSKAGWRWRSALLAVGSTAVVASLDEWHQSHLPSRTGTPWDVVLDTCGAVGMCLLLWLFAWRREGTVGGQS